MNNTVQYKLFWLFASSKQVLQWKILILTSNAHVIRKFILWLMKKDLI